MLFVTAFQNKASGGAALLASSENPPSPNGRYNHVPKRKNPLFVQFFMLNPAAKHMVGGNTIGHRAWDLFSNVFSGGDGVIYAVKDGDLRWYKDLDGNGNESWAGPTTGSGGWDQFSKLFSGGNGVIYAVTKDGDLR